MSTNERGDSFVNTSGHFKMVKILKVTQIGYTKIATLLENKLNVVGKPRYYTN